MQIPVYLRFAVPFLSTPSARRATRRHPIVSNTNQNFYPRPPRGGRQECKKLGTSSKHFYPRPPRGGRRHQMHNGTKTKKISIHALREEGDPHRRNHSLVLRLFLSTPSARRATIFSQCSHSRRHDFYPRPPRGGRRRRSAIQSLVNLISIHALREEGDPVLPQQSARHEEISIHALREEGDICAWLSPCNTSSFLSTPSARRATV